jgi:hypothetical protein
MAMSAFPPAWSRAAIGPVAASACAPSPPLLAERRLPGPSRVGRRHRLHPAKPRGMRLRFTGCERWADVKAGFCTGHYARWKKAGKPADLEVFSRYSSGRGMPMLDMRDLSPQIRLELGLGLQRRAEAGDGKSCRDHWPLR